VRWRDMADTGGLSWREARLVAALLVSPSVSAAAAAAGVSERSASRYLARPRVRAELAVQQSGALGHVAARLVLAMGESVEVLRSVQSDKAVSASARVAAARALLASGLQLAELVALSERVAQLEARLGVVQHDQHDQ